MTDPIRDRERIRQIKRFDGMKFDRNIMPTDIDAFVDFGDQLFVFIETKYGAATLPKGQERALERLCDACGTPERKSILLVTSHTERGDIDLATTRVERIREDGIWRPGGGVTLRAMIDELVLRHAPTSARPGLRKARAMPTPEKSSSGG